MPRKVKPSKPPTPGELAEWRRIAEEPREAAVLRQISGFVVPRLVDEVQRLRAAAEQPTLRDQLAMAALAVVAELPTMGHADEVGCDARAEMAYVYADAMLEARKKKGPR